MIDDKEKANKKFFDTLRPTQAEWAEVTRVMTRSKKGIIEELFEGNKFSTDDFMMVYLEEFPKEDLLILWIKKYCPDAYVKNN